MNTIIQSIQPKWCELIASGKKTIEVRKTLPKKYVKDINEFEPYKVFIYCTKGNPILYIPRKFYDCEQSPYWGTTEANDNY